MEYQRFDDDVIAPCFEGPGSTMSDFEVRDLASAVWTPLIWEEVKARLQRMVRSMLVTGQGGGSKLTPLGDTLDAVGGLVHWTFLE